MHVKEHVISHVISHVIDKAEWAPLISVKQLLFTLALAPTEARLASALLFILITF